MTTASVALNIHPIPVRPPSQDTGVNAELSALRSCPALAGLPAAALAALARVGTIKHFSPGHVVAAEGSPPEHGFVVVRGRLRAVRRGENGREVTIETLRAGDLNADAALDPAASLPADWVSGESTLLLLLPRAALASCLSEFPGLALVLGRETVRRLRRAADLCAGLALNDVPSRVLWALRALAEDDRQPLPEGLLIRHRPTQQELANVIGACRETVSRIVSDLVRQGLLVPRGRGLLLSRQLVDGRRAM